MKQSVLLICMTLFGCGNKETVSLQAPDTRCFLHDSTAITATQFPCKILPEEYYFKSDNEDIATVNSRGIVTGIGLGICNIRIETSYNLFTICRVEIIQRAIKKPKK